MLTAWPPRLEYCTLVPRVRPSQATPVRGGTSRAHTSTAGTLGTNTTTAATLAGGTPCGATPQTLRRDGTTVRWGNAKTVTQVRTTSFTYDQLSLSIILVDCGIIDIDCFKSDYMGPVNVTKSGYECQRWDTNTPNTCHHGCGEKHNQCRNVGEDTPWCYTNSPNSRWDTCITRKCRECDKCKS